MSFHTIRVGLGITFIWIGALIFRDPLTWGSLILPWAQDLLFAPLETVMRSTAVLDIVLGFLLLVNLWTWAAALLAFFHLLTVLITTGITDITVRDIGLLAACAGLFLDSMPEAWKRKFFSGKKKYA